MHLLTVIAEMGSGGAESIADQLARGALERDDAVTLASDRGWRMDRLAVDDVATVLVPLRDTGPLAHLRAIRRLRRHLGSTSIDVVHAHNVRASVVARLATQRLTGRPPVVTTVHGLASHRYAEAARILRMTSDVVVAVSEDVASRLRDGGLPADRLRLIENAPTPLALPERDQARAELGVDRDAIVVLCLARLSPPKRQDQLLEAWSRAVSPGVLLVAGDGPQRSALTQQAERLGLGDRVRFLGDRHDVERLMAASDLLVLPSDREGLPVTVLEAMSAGLPVVASAVGGLLTLDRTAIRLVRPGDVADLVSTLDRTIGDPELRRTLGERGRAVVRERFSTGAMVERYFAVYADVTPIARA